MTDERDSDGGFWRQLDDVARALLQEKMTLTVGEAVDISSLLRLRDTTAANELEKLLNNFVDDGKRISSVKQLHLRDENRHALAGELYQIVLRMKSRGLGLTTARLAAKAARRVDRLSREVSDTDTTREGVPMAGEKLLYLILPKRDREHLPGDLEEEYRTKILPKFGPAYAKRWYWTQVVFSIGPILWAHLRKLIGVGFLGVLTAWAKGKFGL